MFLVIHLVVQIMDMAYPYHQHSLGVLVVLWNARSTTTLLLHALHSRRAACVVRYLGTRTRLLLCEEIDVVRGYPLLRYVTTS